MGLKEAVTVRDVVTGVWDSGIENAAERGMDEVSAQLFVLSHMPAACALIRQAAPGLDLENPDALVSADQVERIMAAFQVDTVIAKGPRNQG